MKRLLLVIIIGILAVCVGAVSAHDHGVHVRVSHLSPTSPTVDVYVGENLVIRQLTYKATSGYLAIDGNVADISLVPAGGALADAVYTENVVFAGSASGYYTVVAVGDIADFTFELFALPEDATPLGSASADNLIVRGAFARPTANAMPHEHEGDDHNTAEATPDMAMPEATESAMDMGGHNMGGMSMGGVSAVYMVIENTGDSADRLLSASTAISGMVQIHQTTVTDGVAQMGEVEGGIEIPAGGVIELKPGGYHIMMMELRGDLVEGTTISVILTFESGTEITLDVPVITP
jgi:copper(I)-binding protein